MQESMDAKSKRQFCRRAGYIHDLKSSGRKEGRRKGERDGDVLELVTLSDRGTDFTGSLPGGWNCNMRTLGIVCLPSASVWIKQPYYPPSVYISSSVKWLLGNNLPYFTFPLPDG